MPAKLKAKSVKMKKPRSFIQLSNQISVSDESSNLTDTINKVANAKPSCFRQLRNVVFSGGTSTSASSNQETNPDDSSDVEDENDTADDDAEKIENDTCLGWIQSTIVGLRFYKGEVSRNETVLLNREPDNIYDKNAIRVDNSFGAQIGHIKRNHAAVLSQILDQKLGKIEGLVTCNKNTFSMPVNLYIYANPQNHVEITNILQNVEIVLHSGNNENWENGKKSGIINPTAYCSLTSSEYNKELGKMFENLRETDKTEEMEAAPVLTTTLYPHQKKALAWMYRRENSHSLPPFWRKEKRKFINTLTNYCTEDKPNSIRGGILADDMGLGKTLQMISLIVSSSKDGKPLALRSAASSARKSCGVSMNAKRNVLSLVEKDCDVKINVIDDEPCTSSASMRPKRNGHKNINYTDEIIDLTDNDACSGSNQPTLKRRRLVVELDNDEDPNDEKSCTVGTLDETFDLSDGEIPLIDSPPPEPFRFTDEDLHSTSETANTTDDLFPRGTLIVCPLSVLSTWDDQIRQHLKPNILINVYQYYGAASRIPAKELKRKDVVLTTYSTLTAASKRKKDPLFEIEWMRVVLDEGHVIRNPNSLQSKACCTLRAERRWILTGTPIQNRLLDMFSLIRFLRVQPLDEKKFWQALIERACSRRSEEGLTRLRCLIQHLAMRRVKTQQLDGKPIIELPPKTFVLETLEFSEDERKLYDVMHKEGKLIVNKYIIEGTLLHNYAHVLAILLRLRQLCCHPFLVKIAAERAKQLGIAEKLLEDAVVEDDHAKDGDAQAERLIDLLRTILDSGSDEECSICIDSLKGPIITPCAHVFCRACITSVISRQRPPCPCPMCRRDITLAQLISVPPEENKTIEDDSQQHEDWHSSAKVDALMKHLNRLREEDPTIKSVIVSQFTSFLNVIETSLMQEGFRWARLDGTMRNDYRQEAIRTFSSKSPKSPTIFLLSLKAGGVGINLIAATRVFLMDPAWNPAVEDQCFDRCHRLGQTKPVFITKFVVNNSVEERMLALQEKKRQLMQDAFENVKKKNVDVRQQRIEEIKLLML